MARSTSHMSRGDHISQKGDMSMIRRQPMIYPELGIAEIVLTRGKVAVIDLCDVERVSAHTWCAKKGDRTWYARAQRRNDDSAKTKIYLARLILDPPPDAWVEHINGDGLDNRRSSLRLRTSGDIQSTFAFVERFWAEGPRKATGVGIGRQAGPVADMANLA